MDKPLQCHSENLSQTELTMSWDDFFERASRIIKVINTVVGDASVSDGNSQRDIASISRLRINHRRGACALVIFR